MVGDTMETDILGGVQMGYRTVLTLSGGTKRKDLDQFAFGPDVIVESIADLCDVGEFVQTSLPVANRDDDTVTNFAAWAAANA
ncbi:Ribonucleotide monophosphatase NagD [Stieleria magnilauensis]|uniref:Ribonucleotide monophosphatase NagD n=1 Tax=Stieleria magnilauensis TaxID=2527963 RepID=A0ABX5Y215_9BACT|nr:Ribonucleotide monophosphatase NagD [Planctomycetes bacterium TBK1r]